MPNRRAPVAARLSMLVLVAALTPAAIAQENADRRLMTANGLLNRGHYDLAAAEYEACLEGDLDANDARIARYGLGVSLFRLGRLGEASEQLERIGDDDRFQFAPEARLLLAHCHLAAGDLGAAIDRCTQVVRRHAEHASADDAGALLAEALYRAGRYEEALEASRAFERRWPESDRRARAELIGAMSLMATARHREAMRVLEHIDTSGDEPSARHAALLRAQCLHATGRMADALGVYEAILADRESAHIADATLGAAQIHHGAGRLDRASDLLDRLESMLEAARRRTPPAPIVASIGPGTALLRARVELDRNEVDRASDLLDRRESMLEAARRRTPPAPIVASIGPGTALLRARVELDRNEVDRARRALEVVGDSKDVSLHDDAAYWLAKCDLRGGEPERSADRLRRAIESYPKSHLIAEMRYDLGVSLTRAGEEEAALDAFESFRNSHPDHALAPDALHTMASLRHRAGEHEACLALSERFLEAYPDHSSGARVRFLAGESEFLLGRHEEAARRFQALLDASHDADLGPLATMRLGLSLDRLDRFDEAEAHLLQVAGRDDPRFASASLALGQGYFDQSRWRDAEAHLEAYLALEDDDAARLRLGLARLRDGRPENALETFDAILATTRDDETRLHATFERGQALMALGRQAEARDAFRDVLEADGSSRFAPHALERLAAIALDEGDSDLAGRLYAQAADASPDDEMAARAMFQQLQSLVASGQHEEAARTASSFADRYPAHAMSPTAHVLRGVALSRIGRHDEALEAFDRVEERAGLSAQMRDTLDYERAYALNAAGRTEEAIVAYESVVDRASGPELRAHAMLDLAALRMDEGEDEAALALLVQVRDLAELVALQDDLLEATAYRLGVAAQRVERHDDAVVALGAFADRWPDSDLVASASLICAESLVRLGRQSEARDHLERAVDRADGADVEAPALLRLGQCQAALTLWRESERTFETYLERHAGSRLDFQARFGLAWAIENQGRRQEAMEHYRRVVDTHAGATAARAQFQIGECLFALGDHEEAVRELLRVDILYDYPEWSAAALYEAGRCFEAMQNADKAREQYALATERFPESDWAAMASERLAALAPDALPGRGGD